jgi:serine protease Do
MSDRSKKIVRLLFKSLVVFIIAAIATIVIEHYIFPRLSTTKLFSSCKFFQEAAENVTIINKTEQVTVKEDDSVNSIASKVTSSVVDIISISQNKQLGKLIPESKSGTGVIVTSDGLVVTYRTAIFEKDATYKILASDGSAYDAELRGVDEFTNLAFLKVNASNLSAIPIADSNDFRPGKKLIAIGNSDGNYQNRFAGGLLSNTNKTFNIAGKTVSSSEKLEGVFETDFADREEYVGGPVINYNGELGGITGSVMVDNQERFFQIPSNVVKKSMDLAIINQLEKRPILGIYYIPITTKYLVANNQFGQEKGAIIFSSSGKQGLAIISGSAAEKAGLMINDIITAVNDQEINLDNPLSNLLNQYKKGDEIELLVKRNGNDLKVKIKF